MTEWKLHVWTCDFSGPVLVWKASEADYIPMPLGGISLIVSSFLSFRGLSSFPCCSTWQILLWKLMKFEIEIEATIIPSMHGVTGMMVPSRPNYRNGDTCNGSDPQGTAESATDPPASQLQLKHLNLCFGKSPSQAWCFYFCFRTYVTRDQFDSLLIWQLNICD